MSRLATSFVLGFHGCDRAVGERALSGETELLQSDREYDWLGPGIYLWESDPDRALEWASSKARRRGHGEPFVIGAVIDLGNCLDLLVRENLILLRTAYDGLVRRSAASGVPMPENEDLEGDAHRDKLLRKLDCAVLRRLHSDIDERNAMDASVPGTVIEPYDTVRGLFTEGAPVYPGAGFHELTHIQIAVRTSRSLKGLFRPRGLGGSPLAKG